MQHSEERERERAGLEMVLAGLEQGLAFMPPGCDAARALGPTGWPVVELGDVEPVGVGYGQMSDTPRNPCPTPATSVPQPYKPLDHVFLLNGQCGFNADALTAGLPRLLARRACHDGHVV